MTRRTLTAIAAGLTAALLVGLLSLGLAGEPAAAAKPEMSAKEKDIRKLLETTGAARMGKQMMDQMVVQLKTLRPDIPAKFWTEFMKEVKPQTLVDLIVPVYDKHLTGADIKGLIAFYESPVGKKFLSVQGKIAKESGQAGEKWGRALGLKVAAKLRAQGMIK